MKKQLTFLCALLFLIMNNLTAQHYQFPNPSFNNWTSTTSDKAVPRGWHSFSEADCQLSGLAALGCSTAKTNHSNTAADRFGATQHACQIYSKNILNTNANGAMTLGKMIIGDTDAESDLNLIYTKTSDADSSGCKWSMAGRPDSVRLWVRFDMASSSVIATCKMHIHGNVNYQDIPSHGAATAQTGKIANAFCEMVKNQGVVKYYNSENQWNGWERFDFKFTYYDAANNVVAQPTPSNITQATTSYILASFSTNKVVGGGSANDKLYFDDLELVYNKKLASLSIGGTNIPSADLVTLNNTAFNSAIGNPHTAYNIFNTQGLAVYDYNQPVCAGAFPEVSATAESGLINGITYTDATVSNPYTTIVVTHNDGSYYTYKVHFTNVQSSPNVTLDNGGNYSVCQNGSLTMTASGNAASYAWSNGLGNINTATPPTGTVGTTTYTVTGYSSNGCPTTATATVTVNPLPSVTLGNNAIQTVCANNTIQPINVNYSGGTPSVDGLGLQFNNSQSVIQGTPNASGQYTITVTSNFTPSCGSTSASGTITVIPQPVATLSQSSVTVCEGMEITPIKVTTSGGSVSYTLPAGLTYNNDTISGIPTENGTISFTTTSENNCGMPATATCSVTLNPSPSVTLSENKNQTLCSGNDFTTITVGSSGGTATVSGLNGTGITYSNGQITGTPNIGTYTYYVTVNSNTCGSVSDTGTIVVNANPTVTLTPSTISVCQGSTIEGVSISPYNNTTTISGLPAGVSFDNTTGLFIGTPSDAGSYPITVSTGTNCGTATTTGTITVKPLPTVTLSNSNIEVCEGEQISSITVTTTNCENSNPVNLLNGLQFSGLNNNSGTITGIPSSAGTFTIDVNSSNLCGSASAEGTVSIKTKPTVSINGPESLCLGTTGTLTAEGNFTSCVWDDNTTSLSRDITPDHAGQFIYNVTATGNGCTNNATTTVNVQSSPAAPTATPTSNSNCHAPYNGSITVTSPTGNYTYSIDGTNFQESTTFSGLAAGPYTLTVKNAAGCTSTAEITVGSTGSNVNAQATANSNTPCAESNLQLTGTSTTPDVTYSWTSTNGFESNDQSPTINNVSADNNGTYTLVVTETATGCTNTASVIITVTPLPTVSIASNPSVCPGTNLNIMIDGQNGSLTASDLPVGASLINGFITGVVTTSGVHTYTVTNSSACGNVSVNGTITVYDLPTITFTGNNSFCAGLSTNIGVQEAYNNYIWSTGSTSQNIPVSVANTYAVTVTDGNGCQNNSSLEVIVNTPPAAPTVSITDNTNCEPFNGSITVTAPLGEGYTYSIDGSSFQSETVFTGLESDEYTIIVQDNNGCRSTTNGVEVGDEAPYDGYTTDITVDDAVNSYVWNGTEYTESGNYTESFTASNGCDSTVTLHLTVITSMTNDIYETACDSYQWGTQTFTQSGNYEQSFVAVNGMDSVVTLHLTILKPAVTLSVIDDITACAGDDITLNAELSGESNGNVSFNWAGPNYTSTEQNINLNDITTAQDGEYTVTATATLVANDVTCTASDIKSVTVTVNTPAVTLADITDKTACAGDNVSINATLSGTPSGTVSYSWTGPDFTSDQQNITLSGITADQSGEYTVVATAAIGNCTATDSKTVNVTVDTPNAGTIAIDGNTTICQGESTTLTASVNGNNGSMTYAWSNNAESESITVSENGNYTVTATATVGECTTTAEGTVNVTVNNPVVGTITISGNTIICQGESTTLTASVNGNNGEVTFAWSNDATGEAITVSEGGNYIVTATATIGECTATATKPVSVTVNALPAVEITGETSFCQGGSTTLTASEGYTYEWNDQSTNPSISATQGGEYSVTVTDGNGCQSTASVNVEALALPDAPDLTATENTSCTAPNGVITVNSPLGDGLSYSINGTDFQTDNVFNGLNAGDFTVTVKNGNGCVNTAVVSVSTVGNTVDATASANTPCAGEDLVLNGSSTTAGVSYSWTGPNNFSYSGQNPTIANASAALNGEYTLTVTENATHCSKSTTVIVSVNTPAVTLADITDKTACAGDNVSINATLSGTPSGTVSYSWNGPDFTSDQQNITLSGITADQSGEYTVVATAAIGNCTATDTKTVNVTVNIPTTGDTTATACESFNWYDHLNITESCNNLTHTLEGGNINGCDSIVTLNLTINHGTYQTIPVTANNSYTWHGETYYTSGTHTYDYVNEDGCPSTDTLDLTILGSTTSVDNQTACNSYEWINGETYTESTNTPTVTLQAANGADSIVVLNLTILKPAVGTLTISGNNAVCQGSSTELTASVAGNNGNVTYVWSNDQTDATITVNPTETFDYTVSATATLTANGVTCTATDNATFTVTVNTPTMGDTTATACESFDWYEHTNITASCNNLTHTLAGANINGCDSIVTLNLTINHGTYQTIPVTANNSYTWHGETYYTSGTHTYDYVNEDGCPSTDTLDLTILGSTTTVDYQTACNSFTWINGVTYTESINTPMDTLTAANGADSIVVLNLTILKPNVGTLTISGNNAVCQGSSTELTASVAGNNGNVTYVWSTDQTDATITVNPTETTEYSVIATATLTANDVTCNATAEEPFTVTVNMPTTGDTTATACESFNWYDHLNITASCSNLTHTLEGANINGCDSIVTLNLTINHGTHNVEPVTANNSYTWHGETYNTSGIQTYDYVNEYGCPSTDTLYLTILDAITTIDNQTACNSYEWIDGETYTESTNTPTVTLQAANGADSIVVLNLTILKPSVGELTIDGDIAFCQNGSTELTATTIGNNGDVAYSWSGPNGFTSNQAIITATEGGDYIVTAMATLTDNGVTCNATSEESFTVTVNVPTSGDTTATACETFDWYEHINITESGDFTHTLAGANINGCDSVVTLHLTINHNVTADTFAVECNTFDWYDHTNITESCDNLTHTFQMANGCDSIVTLHLTILKPTVGTLSIDGDNAVCEGGNVTLTASANGNNGDITYVWSTQYNGETITDTPTESTDYTVTATAMLTFENLNCFATGNAIFHVTMNTPTTGTDTRTACDSLKWLDNETYYVSTTGPTFPLEGANINGCDSIVTLDLTINYSSHFAYTEIECDEFVWHGNSYTTSGTHLYEYTNEEGCPSVDTLYLTIKHGTTGDTTAVECETFDWYEHTNITESCDNLTHTFEAANGCDSIVTLHLTILKPSVGTLTIDGDNAVCQGGEVTLTASANDNNGDISYVWSTQYTGETITDTPTESTDYTVTATATLTFENLNCFATGNATFHVTMNTPTTGTDSRTACDSLKWLDNETYYVSTTGPTFPLEGANINGCDSIVTLDLTINYSSHFAYTEIECDEFVWHGNSYTTSGTHLYEYTNEKGCPSVDTLHLTIKHGTTGDTTAVECETFDWYEYNNITESGDYTHAFPMANGCDSVVTLHITINKPVEIDTTVQVCFFPYTFEGREYNEPTTDEFTITTIDGSCDSILYHLTVSIISSLTVDGHEYPVVKIGSDCWFAENLRIEEGLSDVSAYMNDESYVEKFGRLYNWYDAIGETQPQVAKAAASETAAGACPEGWTIPTVEDFENLIAMADNDIAKLKSPDVTTWLTGSAGSTDGIGFNVPAGGFYNPASLQFERLLLSSQYWTSTSGSSENHMTSVEFGYYCSTLLFNDTPKNAKLSIRCIKIK